MAFELNEITNRHVGRVFYSALPEICREAGIPLIAADKNDGCAETIERLLAEMAKR